MTDARPSAPAGRAFMLIELAVACFVIGTCLLALLAVARSGQRAAAESENETRASLFAKDAFTTLRLFSDRAAADEDPCAWTNFWTGLANGGSVTQFPGFVVEDDASPDGNPAGDARFFKWTAREGPPALCGDDQVHTNIWRPAAMEDDAIPETAVQYRMSISIDPSPGAHGDAPHGFRRVQVTLHVWNGLTRIHPETYTFFGVFANSGRMP